MHNYAQLDSNGRVIGISQLSGEAQSSNLVKLEVFDMNLIGHYYDSVTKTFTGVTADVDKPTITADGIDFATITATIPSALTSVTFYRDDAGQAIQTVSPNNGVAKLQVTSTVPGNIIIRVGEPQFDRKNIVTITAS